MEKVNKQDEKDYGNLPGRTMSDFKQYQDRKYLSLQSPGVKANPVTSNDFSTS